MICRGVSGGKFCGVGCSRASGGNTTTSTCPFFRTVVLARDVAIAFKLCTEQRCVCSWQWARHQHGGFVGLTAGCGAKPDAAALIDSANCVSAYFCWASRHALRHQGPDRGSARVGNHGFNPKKTRRKPEGPLACCSVAIGVWSVRYTKSIAPACTLAADIIPFRRRAGARQACFTTPGPRRRRDSRTRERCWCRATAAGQRTKTWDAWRRPSIRAGSSCGSCSR